MIPLAPQIPPENRETVVAIQGGGIYAMPMLGQARAVLAAGYVPLALAGSSGGAILAVLLWSGLTPDRIEEIFTDGLRRDPAMLTSLLLPRDQAGHPLTFDQLETVWRDLKRVFAKLPPGWLGLERAVLCRWRSALRAGRALAPAWTARGLFSGERFTDLIDTLVREGIGLRSGPATFGAAHLAGPRPPLLLTATNLSLGRLELIDSIDPAYANVPIAAAVRASAGFPVFFRPVDLPGVADGRCFVDGGMIANFPLWAFSRAFREKLQARRDFGWIAPRPWLPIGLRVHDPQTEQRDVGTPEAYAGRLARLAAGLARDDIEDRLVAATTNRPIIVAQSAMSLPRHPGTGAPLDVLDIDAVTAATIGPIIRSGEDAASDALDAAGRPSVFDPGCGAAVVAALETLIRRCEHAFGGAPVNFRGNIFMVVEFQLEMRFSARMAGMSDDGLDFPDLATGVSGWCYQSRTAAICDLALVAQVAEHDDGPRPFNMARNLQRQIDPARTWMISYPVLDPGEARLLPPSPKPAGMPAPGLLGLRTFASGPILGILNIDAAMDYVALGLDPRPDLHVRDPRIAAVIDAVAQASLRVADLLRPNPSEATA